MLFVIPIILGSIAKSTILQYRQCIAGGGFATKSRRSYCPRKADGFAAAFSGTANNIVVCSRGQYIMAFAGWMMQAHPSKNINGLIGYRTKRSMKNMETWKFAHAYCGRLWKIYGIVMFCISVVLSVFFLFMKVETDIVLMGVVVCLQSLILILPILFTERALQQQFDENGNQKK